MRVALREKRAWLEVRANRGRYRGSRHIGMIASVAHSRNVDFSKTKFNPAIHLPHHIEFVYVELFAGPFLLILTFYRDHDA